MDGIDACVREVRKQIGAGADWIKVGKHLSALWNSNLYFLFRSTQVNKKSRSTRRFQILTFKGLFR